MNASADLDLGGASRPARTGCSGTSRSAGRTRCRSLTYSSVHPSAVRAADTAATAIDSRSCGQVGDELDEALALVAEQVRRPARHVGEEQLGGVLRVQADLLEVAAPLEAVHAPLEHEQRHALVPLARVGLDRGDDEVGVDAVGDEGLRAVDDVVVAVADGRGRHRGEVGADARLGHGDGGDQLARRDARQPAGLLLVGAVAQEVRQADVVVQRDAEPGAARAGPLDLLAR